MISSSFCFIILLGLLSKDVFGSSDPICIVGAGISGLNTAKLLQNQGYSVQIFEQNQRVGGKMETYRNRDNIMGEMCPLLYTSASVHILSKIDQYHLTSLEYNSTDQYGFDASTGMISPLPKPSEDQRNKLLLAAQRYAEYQDAYNASGVLEFPFLNAPPEVFVSMAEWLNKRSLQYLIPLFTLAITVEGYGALQDVPALYILRFISPQLLRAYIGDTEKFLYLYEGLDRLAFAMAEDLNENSVFVDYKVTQIKRGNNYQILYMVRSRDNSRWWMRCQKVILAFPPLLKYLNPIIPDLTNYEKSVLEQVKIHKYTSALHYIPSLHENLYSEYFVKKNNRYTVLQSPYGNGEVVGLVRQSSRRHPDIYSSYSWIRGDFQDICDASDIQNINQRRNDILSKLNCNATTYNVKTNAQYFPHVNTSSLQQGFYKKFDGMQGNMGLYYATTMLRFESMDSALVMSEEFVNRYFS